MNASEAINFDTHKFVKHLTENGFTEQQAEVLAEEQVNLLNSNLATKADIEKTNASIQSLHQETNANIQSLRLTTKADIEKTNDSIQSLRQETKLNIADLKAYIEESKADLLKWMFIALAAQGGLIITCVVTLIKPIP